ncbi:MAG: hypothetical protein GY861_24510 [bacterium]|nr:hypothetical protein [bacterium]
MYAQTVCVQFVFTVHTPAFVAVQSEDQSLYIIACQVEALYVHTKCTHQSAKTKLVVDVTATALSDMSRTVKNILFVASLKKAILLFVDEPWKEITSLLDELESTFNQTDIEKLLDHMFIHPAGSEI